MDNSQLPHSFDQAKMLAKADPLLNRQQRIANLTTLERTASDMAQNGASLEDLNAVINKGRTAISSIYPDIPEYEKAVSAAGKFKTYQAANDPQETLDSMPQFG